LAPAIDIDFEQVGWLTSTPMIIAELITRRRTAPNDGPVTLPHLFGQFLPRKNVTTH
jgi:hypothetical protein